MKFYRNFIFVISLLAGWLVSFFFTQFYNRGKLTS